MSVEYNKKFAYTICEKWSVPKGGDVEPFLALFHDDAGFTTIAQKSLLPELGGRKTKDEFRQFIFRESRATDINVWVEGVTADENRIAVEAASDMNINGNTYRNAYHWLFEMRDGKISDARFYFDTLFAAKAIEWIGQVHATRLAK